MPPPVADDPYYCGLRARVPNFVKTKSSKEQQRDVRDARDARDAVQQQRQQELLHSLHNPYGRLPLPGNPHFLPPPPHQPHMWHARSYDSGMGESARTYVHFYHSQPPLNQSMTHSANFRVNWRLGG